MWDVFYLSALGSSQILIFFFYELGRLFIFNIQFHYTESCFFIENRRGAVAKLIRYFTYNSNYSLIIGYFPFRFQIMSKIKCSETIILIELIQNSFRYEI